VGHLLLAIAVLLSFLIGAATIWVPHSAALIQNQLHERARGALIANEQDYVAVSVDGRDLILSGLAPDHDSRSRALALVENIAGVRVVHEQIEISARYVLQASYSDSQLCLRGVIPSEALRLEWTALSPMPCMRDLDAALGVDVSPSGWIWPGLLLRELIRLESATLQADEQSVSVTGMARNVAQRDVIESTLRRVIPTAVQIRIDIQIAPPRTPAGAPVRSEETPQ
jgi:hypothetical protein